MRENRKIALYLQRRCRVRNGETDNMARYVSVIRLERMARLFIKVGEIESEWERVSDRVINRETSSAGISHATEFLKNIILN